MKTFLILGFACLLLPHVKAQTHDRACGLPSDTEHKILIRVIKKGAYDVPVAERTLLERSVLRRYQRYKDFYSIEKGRLYYKGKELLCESNWNKIIVEHYKKNKGLGCRGLYKLLKRDYAGVSEIKIRNTLSKHPEYQRKVAKFLNKAPLKHVCSRHVHEILQIDLVDMSRDAVIYNKEKCKFILSVMDVFSRFVWLRAIPRKSADVVTKQLRLLFAEFGKPVIIQHDRGREFDGQVKRFLREQGIRNIKSRPYHPQSQGKVERMHKTLKQKIAYDLIHANPCGINWAKQLPEYQRILNNVPKECLAWNTPHDVYYGRDPQSATYSRKIRTKKIRDAAKAATIKCNERTDKARGKACKTPAYSIGDRVFLRYKKKGLLNRRTWVVDGIIQQRSLDTNMYKIKHTLPDSTLTNEKWFHISDISKCRSARTLDRKQLHRENYYITLTKLSQLENLRSEFGLPIIMNPPGNGNCQFAAVSHQLSRYGVHRSDETLREDVVTFLSQNPALGNDMFPCSEYWWNSILEQPEEYLSRMSRTYEYGDQITLQAISQLYNVHFPTIILGHYPEGAGEHYVSLGHDRDVLKTIIDRSRQITWETGNSTIENDLDITDINSGLSNSVNRNSSQYFAQSPISNMDINISDTDSQTGNMNVYSSGADNIDMIISDTDSRTRNRNACYSEADNYEMQNSDIDSQIGKQHACSRDVHNSNVFKCSKDSRNDDIKSRNYEVLPDSNNLDSSIHEINAFDFKLHEYDVDSHVSGREGESSDFLTQIEQLRDKVEIKRKQKRIMQKQTELPPEIWSIIINIVLRQNPLSRFSLQKVNRLFKGIVHHTPSPRLYLNPDRFRNIHLSPISVRKIIRMAGVGSGLVQAIRNLIASSSWANAWLFLRIATICGWYTIEGIWYKRPRN